MQASVQTTVFKSKSHLLSQDYVGFANELRPYLRQLKCVTSTVTLTFVNISRWEHTALFSRHVFSAAQSVPNDAPTVHSSNLRLRDVVKLIKNAMGFYCFGVSLLLLLLIKFVLLLVEINRLKLIDSLNQFLFKKYYII